METKASLIIGGLSSVGLAAGLYFAYTKDQKFWGYVGFGLLGSILLAGAGRVIYGFMKG